MAFKETGARPIRTRVNGVIKAPCKDSLLRRRDILLFAPLLLAVGLFAVLWPARTNRQVEEETRRRVRGLAEVMAGALAPALGDAERAGRVLALLATQGDVLSAALLDGRGRAFTRWPAGSTAEPPPDGSDVSRRGSALVAIAPIRSRAAARVLVVLDARGLASTEGRNWMVALSLGLVVGVGLVALVARLVVRHRRAEQALADLQARFSVLVEGIPDALVIFEREGLSYANAAARRLLGLDDSIGPGRIDPAQALAAIEVVGETEGESRLIEVPTRRGPLHLEVRTFAIAVDGHPAALSLARDVTEERRPAEGLRPDRMPGVAPRPPVDPGGPKEVHAAGLAEPA